MKHVAKHLSQYDYEYYGDTAHLPYGDRSEAEIYELTKAGIVHLFAHDCVLVIIACNTASAETLRRLQDEWLPIHYPDRRILGVIIPTIETVAASDCSPVLLVATARTVASGKYERELQKCGSAARLTAVATPTLVPLIEAGECAAATDALCEVIDQSLAAGVVEGVVLGCTHYGLLVDALRARWGGKLTFFSQQEIIPAKLTVYLKRHPEIEVQLSRGGKRNIFLTEHRVDYDRFLQTVLNGRMIVEE